MNSRISLAIIALSRTWGEGYGSPGFCAPSALNQAFIEQTETIAERIGEYSGKNMPFWVGMVGRDFFQMGEGYTKQKYIFHSSPAPQTDANSLWTAITQSDDPEGRASCNPPAVTLSYGFEQKTYTPYELTLATDDICLRDFEYFWQFRKQMDMIYSSFASITMQVWENWNRDTYGGECMIYAATEGSAVLSAVGASRGALPSINAIQIGYLTQGILELFYSILCRQAGLYAMGMESGSPVFGLITSQEDSKHLVFSDNERREDFRLADPSWLFKGLGAALTYQKFVHMHDPFCPRYDVDPLNANQLVRVWPHKSASTTIGTKWDINPAYIDAPFQVSYIWVKDTFINRMFRPTTNFGGKATADPADFFGEFFWLNIQSEDCNPYREIGHYRARFRVAPEPGDHDFAIGILHRRCDVADVFNLCAEDDTTPVAYYYVERNASTGDCVDTDAETQTLQIDGNLQGYTDGDEVTLIHADITGITQTNNVPTTTLSDNGDGTFDLGVTITDVPTAAASPACAALLCTKVIFSKSTGI